MSSARKTPHALRTGPPRVYIVQVWPVPRGGFQAAVRPVGAERSAWFTRTDALALYFATLAGHVVADGPSA